MTDPHRPRPAADVGPMTVRYPSTTFPAPPPFSLDLPGDWHPVTVPDAELSARSPRTSSGFHANVVARARRVAPAPDDATAYLRREVVGDLLRGPHEVLRTELLGRPDHPAQQDGHEVSIPTSARAEEA